MGKRKRAMIKESSENETNGEVTIEQEATKDVQESQSKKVCIIYVHCIPSAALINLHFVTDEMKLSVHL